MRGAPARAIQDLVGHADLTTTHLSPAATEDAIRLLDRHGSTGSRGEMWETGLADAVNCGV